MIYTITFNPSIDYFTFIDKKLEDGAIIKTGNTKMVAAGKGVNISLVLANMRKESKAVMFLGGHMGEFIKDQLDENKYIEVCGVQIEQENRINVKIQNNLLNEETAINANGPFVNEEKQMELLKFLSSVKENDTIAISGSYCKGVDKTIVKKISDIAKTNKAKLVCDVANLTLEDYQEIKPFLIKPNKDELGEIFKVEVNMDNYAEYVDKLLDIGVENVLLSLGKHGSYFANKKEKYRGNGPQLKVITTVGCGDTMLSTFIGQYDNGLGFKEALKYGEAAGRTKTLMVDLPTIEQTSELLDQIIVEKVD